MEGRGVALRRLEAPVGLLAITSVGALGLGKDPRLGWLLAHDGVADGVLRSAASTTGTVALLT